MLPNFIIGGATASGTSFLTHLLMQHSDIYLPKDLDMEPHFFSLLARYEKGIDWYQKTWFSDYQEQQACGERSTTYFHFPEAAERLKKHLPSAKFIFVLRDPSERAFAQYRYMVLRGIEELDFKKAIEEEKWRLDIEKRHHEYIGRSLYGKQLENFLKSFSLDQILILNSEKLRRQTETQLKRVTDFLGIAPLNIFKITSDFSSPAVKDRRIQIKGRAHFGKAFKFIIETIRYKKDNLHSYAKTELDRHRISQLIENLSGPKEILVNEMKISMRTYFKDDQAKFFDLAKDAIDFDPWL